MVAVENVDEQGAAAESAKHHSSVVAIHPRPVRMPRMLKGFCYTPPVIGRIAIGETVEKDGKRLPRKSDEISITAQHKKDGRWVEHPLDARLRGKSDEKLREIPVRLLFDDPDLSFRESYEAFVGSRQVCVGDGEKAKRRGAEGALEEIVCNGPDSCEFGSNKTHHCKPFARLNVQIDGQDDLLSTFIFRTSGWNSIRTLRSKLEYLYGAFGALAGLPLKLVMRGKSTQLSFNTPFFYLDLMLRDSTPKGVIDALDEQKMWRAGLQFDYIGLENAARQGLRNGAFEETQDDAPDIEDWTIPAEGAASGNKSLDDVFAQGGSDGQQGG